MQHYYVIIGVIKFSRVFCASDDNVKIDAVLWRCMSDNNHDHHYIMTRLRMGLDTGKPAMGMLRPGDAQNNLLCYRDFLEY